MTKKQRKEEHSWTRVRGAEERQRAEARRKQFLFNSFLLRSEGANESSANPSHFPTFLQPCSRKSKEERKGGRGNGCEGRTKIREGMEGRKEGGIERTRKEGVNLKTATISYVSYSYGHFVSNKYSIQPDYKFQYIGYCVET